MASQLLVILGIVALIMMLFVMILKLRYVFLRRTEDNEKYENRISRCIIKWKYRC